MNDLDRRRKEEHKKYELTYKRPVYRMGNNRRKAAQDAIRNLRFTGSLLDVGCGRGEILEFAKELGFKPVTGVEVVDYLLNDDVVYGEAYSLPFDDNSFDVVTSFDVFEHLLPEDTEISLRELDRVASRAVILCVPNLPSMNNVLTLHINLRPYREWDRLIKENMSGKVDWIPKTHGIQSETWVITKE